MDSLNRQNDLFSFLQKIGGAVGNPFNAFTLPAASKVPGAVYNTAVRALPGGSSLLARTPSMLGPAALLYGMGDGKGNFSTPANGGEQNLIPPDVQASLRNAARDPHQPWMPPGQPFIGPPQAPSAPPQGIPAPMPPAMSAPAAPSPSPQPALPPWVGGPTTGPFPTGGGGFSPPTGRGSVDLPDALGSPRVPGGTPVAMALAQAHAMPAPHQLGNPFSGFMQMLQRKLSSNDIPASSVDFQKSYGG